MSRKRCAIVGCQEANISLHSLPKDRSMRDQWLLFIFSGITKDFSPNLTLCSAHFTADCFINQAQFNAGFAKKLLIKDTAVPTLLSPTSTQKPVKVKLQTTTDRYKHAGTQTDPPSRSAAATQLSIGTLSVHVRSKGTQTLSCPSVGSGSVSMTTAESPASPTSDKGTRAAKRPRIELIDEEERMCLEGPEPQVSTDDLDDASTIITDPSQLPPTPSAAYGETKYIVYGSCLLELFETCPVCRRACDISQRTQGTYLAIDQLCPHCQFSRKWKSQPVFGSTPAGNLHLSAAIYFTGASFPELEKISKAMHIQMFKYDTFRRHARMYLEPIVIHKWKQDQENLPSVPDLCRLPGPSCACAEPSCTEASCTCALNVTPQPNHNHLLMSRTDQAAARIGYLHLQNQLSQEERVKSESDTRTLQNEATV